jgi:hypothetical protein
MMSMQRRMSEWQKNMVMPRRTMMKRIWISWPISRLVRAMARSIMCALVHGWVFWDKRMTYRLLAR